MDAKAREELVGVVALLLAKKLGGCGYFTDTARAALAVIEPVVREECAKVADMLVSSRSAAAAIRGGSNGG